MRKATLTDMEIEKYNYAKDLCESKLKIATVAVKLGFSYRYVLKLKKKFKEQGEQAFMHGNVGRKPKHTIPDETRTKIIDLYKTKYSGFNYTHFREKLSENEKINISYNALYNLLTSYGFISPRCERKTRRKKVRELKLLQQQKNKKIENEQNQNNTSETVVTEKINTTEEAIPYDFDYTSHPRKPRAKYEGELLQMDASNHLWFGDTKHHLHVAIDDATGKIVGAFFDQEETLNGYYNVLYQILITKGIPVKFLTDNRTVFIYNSLRNRKESIDTSTQFAFACSKLGIEIETTSVAEAKGRIERLFLTLQDRLCKELKLREIKKVQEANEFLTEFIKEYNKRFSVRTNYTTSAFETQPESELINYTLAVIMDRVVDKGNCIKFQNKYYQFYYDGKMVTLPAKTKVQVVKAFDGTLLACKDQIFYTLYELPQNYEKSTNFDDLVLEEKPKVTYKPKDCHPWAYTVFKTKRAAKYKKRKKKRD